MAYKQAQNRKKRLYKTYRQTRTSCRGGVWFDDNKGYYRKYYISNSGSAKFLRKCANKKVRKLQDLSDHGAYKKAYDYWWIRF